MSIVKSIAILLSSSFTLYSSAQTNISAGNVYGTWKKTGSPYKINGNIVVPKDSIFRIESGVQVVFQGNYSLEVKGSIQALGAANDTITFTAANKSTGWGGIRLRKNITAKDSNIFNFCKLEYRYGLNVADSRGAINVDSATNVRVSNCLFQYNKAQYAAGIFVIKGKLKLYNSLFRNNEVSSTISSVNSASSCAFGSAFSTVNASGCYFLQNKASLPLRSTDSSKMESGAVVSSTNDDTFVLINSNFIGNYCTASPGITYSPGGKSNCYFLVQNCNFYGNMAKIGAIFAPPVGTPVGFFLLDNLHFDGNVFNNNSGAAAIIGSIGSTASLNRIKITSTSKKCDGISTNMKISNSYLTGINGVAVYNRNTTTTILNSIITNNNCGVACSDGGTVTIVNSVIAYNGNSSIISQNYQGGIAQGALGPRINLINNIIQGNRVGGKMYNLMSYSGTVVNTLKNNILEGGKDSARALPSFNPLSFGIDTDNQNDTVWFVKAPKGAGVAFADTTCDFRVRNTCSYVPNILNAGINPAAYINPVPETDYAGNKRVQCSKIDIGPYELEGAKKFVSIDQEPTDQKVCPRSTVTIAPTACGAALGYQWQKSTTSATTGFANIGSANALNYAFMPKDSGWYRLIITQADCNKKDTSVAAKISFKTGSSMAITAQPRDTGICAKSSFNLNAGVQGTNNTYRWQNSKTSATAGFTDINGGTSNPYSQKILDSSWYRLIIKNTLCNYEDTTKASKINKLPLPAPTLGSDQSLAYTGSKVLNPGTFTSYLWSHPISAPATTPTLTVDKNNLTVGTNKVWVEVSNSYGCKGRDTINITLQAADGVLDPTSAGIGIYPIPMQNQLQISLPENIESATYQLTNLAGQKLLSGTAQGASFVDVSTLSAGTYFLTLQAGDRVYGVRVVK